jgi:hypothetical protein
VFCVCLSKFCAAFVVKETLSAVLTHCYTFPRFLCSIAYGKSAFGLSKDWGVSAKEATETVEKWFEARPEVKKWQVGSFNVCSF